MIFFKRKKTIVEKKSKPTQGIVSQKVLTAEGWRRRAAPKPTKQGK